MSPLRQFDRLTQSYLEETWALFPHEASDLGLHQFDAELGENDAATWQAHGRLLAAALMETEALPDASFSGDPWLDRRAFLSLLRTGLHWNQKLERWRNNPQVHCDNAIQSILNLVIRNSDRLAQTRPAIESRLGKIPRFLSQGAACLRKPVPLWTRLARKSCDHVEEFLTDLGEQLAPSSPAPERTRQLAREAIAAFSKYAAAAENKAPGASNGFAVGREAFEFLTREKTGLSHSLPEIRTQGNDLAARLSREVEIEARKFGRKKAGQILEEAAARWKPVAGSLLEEYRRMTGLVRDQFAHAGVVTFPKNEKCRVVAVPPFLRHHFPTAAYSQPGAFDKDQTGIFWVNDLGTALTDPAK
ncbi:MAG: DUF885 family protein, partial [Verrucomicrobiota bacterium]